MVAYHEALANWDPVEAQNEYDAALAQYETAQEAYEQEYGPPLQPDPVPGAVDAEAAGGGLGGIGGGAGGGGGAGKPAAPLGNSTAHGGVITVGDPMTLISEQPAARLTDMHNCPMTEGPKPHVGGPIAAGSPTVIISGLPAARMGDQATCVAPPDTIAKGDPTVMIG